MRAFPVLLACVLCVFHVGCATIRVTDPPRTATEQLLISRAATAAVNQIATDSLRDRLVFIDTTLFLPDVNATAEGNTWLTIADRQFALAELRSHLLLNGVRLTTDRETSQIVMELRTGGIGVDRSDYLLGIPPVLIPAGAAGVGDSETGTIVTPELAILKNIRQESFASLAYIAYWRDSGEVVASSGPFIGRGFRSDWWYFGVGPRTTGNIPTTENE